MHFKKYFLLYTIIPLLVVSSLATYHRFMIAHDYVVEYEGNCDPLHSSCYIGCEDDECSSEYYYAIVRKNAAQLLDQCGPDITNCPAAHQCLNENDDGCSITYCVAGEAEDVECTDREGQEYAEDTDII